MLQLGFALDPLQSGMLTFASAAGSMFMKTMAARIIRRFGFRRVLLANAFVASGMLATYALFRPATPHVAIFAVLLVSGCFRSLQFTGLNAISYAEVDQARMGQATSMAAMMLQLSVCLGVAIGGYVVEAAGWLWDRPDTDVHNFYVAFIAVALVSASSAWMMWKLPRDAGAEMAGRARPGGEIAEPKVEQRPAT
jgi:MFS family permease